MKKWTVWIALICLLLNTSACGSRKDSANQSGNLQLDVEENGQTAETEEEEVADNDMGENVLNMEETEPEHILIAYFSWADNTVVKDEESAVESALSHYESIGDRENYDDVDAASSASILKPGNTAQMAQWIQEYVGGDIFPIIVTDMYPDNYEECMDRAADEKAQNARPELAEQLDNIEDYDVIFLGFPNWWYTAPMAVFSFIESYDLSDKTIVPFCSHGTGGIAGSVRDITDDLPDSANVLEPIGVYRADINQAQPLVNEWLTSLGFQKKESEEQVDNSEKKLKMTIDGQEVSITLYDTPAANALYDMCPLELNFEDFNGTEKISYLPQNLPTEGEPDGCDPDVGDFCLYAPWGNLSVFYQDFRYSDGLILLGHIDSGIELLSNQENDFSVTLEAE